jgi:hypothetical protein
VRTCGYALQHVERQTPEVCESALLCEPYSLRYVRDQTFPICLFAVKINSDTLRFIRDPRILQQVNDHLTPKVSE